MRLACNHTGTWYSENGVICMLFGRHRYSQLNWITCISSFSSIITNMSVHVGEDLCVWVVSYILTRIHKLNKWIKHSAGFDPAIFQ